MSITNHGLAMIYIRKECRKREPKNQHIPSSLKNKDSIGKNRFSKGQWVLYDGPINLIGKDACDEKDNPVV